MIEQNIAEKIKQRRRQILVHSFIYYKLDENIVSDNTWATWGKELVELQNKYPEISQEVEMYEYFKDFDASSGNFLPMGLPWVQSVGNRLLKLKIQKNKKVQPVTKKQTSANKLF